MEVSFFNLCSFECLRTVHNQGRAFTPSPSSVSAVHLNTAREGLVRSRPAPPPRPKPPRCPSQLTAGPERGGVFVSNQYLA